MLMTKPRVLRIALTLARDNAAVTSSALAKAADMHADVASVHLGRYEKRGLLRTVSGNGVRHDPYVYKLDLDGERWLERDAGAVVTVDFGPLLAAFGVR